MIALCDRAAALTAFGRARSLSLAAYLIPPSVTECLVAAAERGARVQLALAQYPVAETPQERWRLACANREAVEAVRAAGGTAELLPPANPLHLKAALVDGRTVYLDDRNWADDGPQTILRDDDPSDVAAIRMALEGRPGGEGRLATRKPDSLEMEVRALAGAGDGPVALETESFGIGPVYDELELRAAARAPTRLVVCERELEEARRKMAARGAVPGEIRALDRLTADGIDVRVTPAAEKMALAGDAAWVGSTNATRDWGSTARQRDWGMQLRDPAIVAALRARFERTWDGAVPYADETTGSGGDSGPRRTVS